MNNQEPYQTCRETVEHVRSLRARAAVLYHWGPPIQDLPIGDFFITHADRTVTYCDLVELFHINNCAIRIGYIDQKIVKVLGMPLEHWIPPEH